MLIPHDEVLEVQKRREKKKKEIQKEKSHNESTELIIHSKNMYNITISSVFFYNLDLIVLD